MANLDETFEKPEFDWSAISVGDYKLDHSQNFFANKENNRNLNNGTPKAIRFKAAEEQEEEKVIMHDHENKVLQDSMSKLAMVDELTSNLSLKESPATKSELAPSPGSPVQLEEKTQAVIKDENETKVIYDDIEHMPEDDSARAALGNLRMQWSPIRREHVGTAAASASAPVPKAYAFKDFYEYNRQQALRRQQQEDRQARQFNSRPMPNFKAMHKRIDDMVVVHRITVPRTPETVKYWKTCVERRRQAKLDHDEEEEQRQSSLGSVHQRTRHKAFNLHSDQRVRDRRDFDSAVQERQIQKKKEVNK